MALRRRRGESDDTFEDHHPHLDWNAIVQVEPDVGVTAGEQWPDDAQARRTRPDPYAPPAETIYDVEKEAAVLADPAAVEAWFNGDVANVVPSTRTRPDPVPVQRPTAPAMPAAVSEPTPQPRPPASGGLAPQPASFPPAVVPEPVWPAPVLPPARFDPTAAPFEPPGLSRPGARTVPSRTRLKPANPATITNPVPPPPPPARLAPASRQQSAPQPQPAKPRGKTRARPTSQPAPTQNRPTTPAPQPRPAPPPAPSDATRRALPPPPGQEAPLRPSVATEFFSGAAGLPPIPEARSTDRHGRNAERPSPSQIQGPHDVRWADQPRTAANAPNSRSPLPGTYTDEVSGPAPRDDMPRSPREPVSRGQTDGSVQTTPPTDAAFLRRTGSIPALPPRDVPFKMSRATSEERAASPRGTDAPSSSQRVRGKSGEPGAGNEPAFVIELSNEPPRFAQPFRVEPAGRDYDDDLDLISGLIFIEKPEPLYPVVVRWAPGASRSARAATSQSGARNGTSDRAPVAEQGAVFNAFEAHVGSAPVKRPKSRSVEKPFSFVALVGGDGAPSTTRGSSPGPKPASKAKQSIAKQPPGQTSASAPERAKATQSVTGARAPGRDASRSRSADSVVYRRDDDPRGAKRVVTARQKKPALSIRTVEDPVERLLIDHQDLQLSHFGPIVVESSLWPPDMHIDSINEHMQTSRWPREEGIEVWIRLPQICDALWGELARTDLVSGSTIETWITNNDVDDRILHQMRLSISVDDAENPRELLRVYRAQAEEFVGYGLDGIISRPADRR